MEKLSLILWRERELLETLHYKLEVEQLIMAAGETRWLARAAREVEELLQVIRETEMLRAIEADTVAAEVGIDPNPSLSSLIEVAQEPWASILTEHRESFATVTEHIIRVAELNRSLIAAGFRSARETLLNLGGGIATYTPEGAAVTAPLRAARLDWSL
ncbi:flagellar protein FlgN [Nocardioides pacificus]